MEESKSGKEMKVLLVGSNSSRKYLVGNIILGREEFDVEYATTCCERAEGDVCGRRATLAKPPGWLRGYNLCNTPELFKTEATLSVTPGLHAFLLVIDAEQEFKNTHKKATKQHLQHCYGDKVWDHTIVVFSHSGHIDQETIKDYIKKQGAPLQSLLEDCGNRYHVLCEDGTDKDKTVQELFEKIDAMVAENNCYEIDKTLVENAASKRSEVDKNAEELRLRSQQERQKLRSLLTEPKPVLRILMVGWVFSGKTAAANSVLGAEVFQAGDRTVRALKQSGTVAGREVVIVDTPGWWKFFPAKFIPSSVKCEISKGVSLCSPSPNVILLAVPVTTSFTEEQRRVTVGNMRQFGQTVWRHVIVVFTIGETMANKTIEQHIESEGEPLRWLIEKCGNRYHVLDSSRNDEQVTELLEKMEEMVAGNYTLCIIPYPDADDPQLQEDRSDKSTEIKVKKTAAITEQLNIEWDRKNWKKDNICDTRSMDGPPYLSDRQLDRDYSKEEQTDQHEEDDHLTPCFDVDSEDDAGSSSLNRLKKLLEEEWSRREVVMELALRICPATSDPDSDRLRESRAKVTNWLRQASSGYGTASNKSRKSEDDVFHLKTRPPQAREVRKKNGRKGRKKKNS